jgi:hypothetical protein
MPAAAEAGNFFNHAASVNTPSQKISIKKRNIVDSFFAPEKIPATIQGNFDNTVSKS